MAWVLDQNTVNVITGYRADGGHVSAEGNAVNSTAGVSVPVRSSLEYGSGKTQAEVKTEALVALEAEVAKL